jgi:hypothetical protein
MQAMGARYAAAAIRDVIASTFDARPAFQLSRPHRLLAAGFTG